MSEETAVTRERTGNRSAPKGIIFENWKICCFLIIASVLAVYAQVSTFDFLNFDDNIYITENPVVLSGLNAGSIRWAFTSTLGGHWHPLSWLSLMADVSFFGSDPSAMHLVNLAFHVVNSVLVFFLLSKVTDNQQVGLISALLFALHPLRMESVAWVSQRKDLLSLCLGLTTALLYLKSRETQSNILYGASLSTFILALLAKPTMITLPVLLILLEISCLLSRGQNIARVVKVLNHRDKLPFLLVASVIACLALASQSQGGGLRNLNEYSLLERFDIICTGYIAYLGKLFWPFQRSVFYPIATPPSGLAFGCLICLFALSIGFWNARARYPELVLAWLWFIVSLLPVIGFVMIGAQAVADRWTQLSHIGPIAGLTYLWTRTMPRLQLAPAVIVPLLAFLTFQGLAAWQDSEHLFTESLQSNANNFLAHTNLGAAQVGPDKLKSRVHHFEEAARLNPAYPEALNNLGMVRAQEGRFLEAKGYFEKALSLNPGLSAARNNLTQVELDLRTRQSK